MTMTAELRDITKIYGNKTVLNNINLQIHEGEILALLGPNGSGKTTILKILAFVEDPTSGEVEFEGEKVNFKNTEKVRLQSTLVFQKTTLFGTSVYNNIAYGLKIRKIPKETRGREVKKALELVKLEGFEKRPARKLSGGEQQRVVIARALALKHNRSRWSSRAKTTPLPARIVSKRPAPYRNPLSLTDTRALSASTSLSFRKTFSII